MVGTVLLMVDHFKRENLCMRYAGLILHSLIYAVSIFGALMYICFLADEEYVESYAKNYTDESMPQRKYIVILLVIYLVVTLWSGIIKLTI